MPYIRLPVQAGYGGSHKWLANLYRYVSRQTLHFNIRDGSLAWLLTSVTLQRQNHFSKLMLAGNRTILRVKGSRKVRW